ncbi:MAG: diaminopimelate decarboxylase [Actinobacteria bacterium]|nr:MAG: diaminopimelate decarboxylase [Actinomycetota bacterium]
MLELFPDTAELVEGELVVGGVRASNLAAEHGTPLVVYCRETILAQARAFRAIDPDALVAFGVKAFPNVAVLRLLREEGLGADVSTLGELQFALRAGVRGEQLLFHGNNKSDEELEAAAAAEALVVLDSGEEVARAARAGVRRVLVRLTPGIQARTHQSIQTAHDESKFGLDPDGALAALREALEILEPVGVHVHIGSQLARVDESLLAVDRLVAFCRRCREELGWAPRLVDLGGGPGIRHSAEERVPEPHEFARALVERLRSAWPEPTRVALEPGRSLVGRAGVTLYRIGATKRSGGVDYAAIDGGMSDNPRPQLYGARYDARLANRDGPAEGEFRIAGKHCESGDVLIDRIALPRPHRGDLLAVPATGAYTLSMASNYNGVPRPAAVLVADGVATVIRRRETIDDLLALEP